MSFTYPNVSRTQGVYISVVCYYENQIHSKVVTSRIPSYITTISILHGIRNFVSDFRADDLLLCLPRVLKTHDT